jgi:hypothetical protein
MEWQRTAWGGWTKMTADGRRLTIRWYAEFENGKYRRVYVLRGEGNVSVDRVFKTLKEAKEATP